MADLTDVANALVTAIAAAAYPSGTAQPSVGNVPILVYQGWPNPAALTADLLAGKVHINVFPRPNDRVTSLSMGDDGWVETTNNGVTGTSIREVRRQTRTFQITLWANCYDHRDPVASAIDSALAVMTRLVMPDTTQAIASYLHSTQDDDSQKQGVYRRDFFFDVNYATTQVETEYAVKEIDLNSWRVASASDPSSPRIGVLVSIATTATGVVTTITP
jgi:hypothetical protein